MPSDGYRFIYGVMVRTGPGTGDDSPQAKLIRRWKAAGGNVRDLERLSRDIEEDTPTVPAAMRKLGRAVARQHKPSDLFDHPTAGWSKDWEKQ